MFDLAVQLSLSIHTTANSVHEAHSARAAIWSEVFGAGRQDDRPIGSQYVCQHRAKGRIMGGSSASALVRERSSAYPNLVEDWMSDDGRKSGSAQDGEANEADEAFDPAEYDLMMTLERLESLEEDMQDLGVTSLEEVRRRIAELHQRLDARG